MSHFVDEVHIRVSSGNGGAGCVSFRREKYIPLGGPDGGDGGRGGDVVFQVQRNLKTLTHIRPNSSYAAKSGTPGKGRQKTGPDGSDVVIPVPPGTRILDEESREVLLELEKNGESVVFLPGGIGGQGNQHFATSRNQAPRFAQPGMPGESREIVVEMNLIADIGFVGFPNAGKSSLLKALTAADPKVAPYPFTTKIPNLGVLRMYDEDLVLADIPGIIEGASEGAGLGLRFLKHITRTAGLAFLIDVSEEVDHVAHFRTLLSELEAFAPELLERPRIVVATKLDMPETANAAKKLLKALPDEKHMRISTHTHEGLDELSKAFWDMAHPQKEKGWTIRRD